MSQGTQPINILDLREGEAEFTTAKDSLIQAKEVVEQLSSNVANYIYDEFINQQTLPYSLEHLLRTQLRLIEPDISIRDIDAFSSEVDREQSEDEPVAPVKDPWSTSFIHVDKVNKIIYPTDGSLGMSPFILNCR